MTRAFSLDAGRAEALLREFGSPLYVYSEEILRAACRELAAMLPGREYHPSYSLKANGNPALLRIIGEEGLYADAMSPGELALLARAGFDPARVLFVPNNVEAAEFADAVGRGVLCSVDSLDQLRLFAVAFPGARVALRINPGVGDGHHAKVVTGGRASKFGIVAEEAAEAMGVAARAGLRVAGLNQHIGSGFMGPDNYLAAAAALLDIRDGIGAGGLRRLRGRLRRPLP